MKKKTLKNLSLQTDVWLLVFMALFAATAILMTMSAHLLVNTVFIGILAALLLLTYFYGIVAGLIGNFAFIFVQAVLMIYYNTQAHVSLPLELSFWLFLPLLLCVALYFFTQDVCALQEQNRELKTSLVEHGAFDSQTNLRTTNAYLQDAQVAIENNYRFDLPVTLMVFRIRYYEEIRRLLSDQRLEKLLLQLSQTVDGATRTNDLAYFLDDQVPTWGVLLYTDKAGAQIAGERVKQKLDESLSSAAENKQLNITLTMGVVSWDEQEMKEPYDLVRGALKEMEYDV
ncbi:diguanylate cyclase [Ligilactobacillus salitolerans]|uniref:Diguanylate cyclase n=1 Tax=Ligilactobacillus salitolerans TaxID=1808352 RepID=A0A401IV00_9LACO|nr:diguanylate cyclase [Ligilactobacillus salitolerans]GBG95317.1 diguanylate cyclase [Ligilactobacillus salitolerans]